MNENPIEESERLGMELVKIAEAYASNMSGMKTKMSGFGTKFISEGDDVTGIQYIITLDLIEEENENG